MLPPWVGGQYQENSTLIDTNIISTITPLNGQRDHGEFLRAQGGIDSAVEMSMATMASFSVSMSFTCKMTSLSLFYVHACDTRKYHVFSAVFFPSRAGITTGQQTVKHAPDDTTMCCRSSREAQAAHVACPGSALEAVVRMRQQPREQARA